MKKFFYGAVVLISLSGCGWAEDNSPLSRTPTATEESQNVYHTAQRISVEDFKKAVDAGDGIVLDVRTAAELQEGRVVDEPLHLDFYAHSFKQDLSTLDRSDTYLLYCRSGNRSGQTLRMMKEMGFENVYELDGGINAWAAAGYPVVK